MKLLKLNLHEGCQMIALADDDENILTAAAFSSENDADSAADLLYSLLVNVGAVKSESGDSSPVNVQKLLDTAGDFFGAYQAYVREL